MKYSLKFVLAIFLAMIFALGASQPARAQQATGRIIGNVTDPSGTGSPNVQVKATNVATPCVLDGLDCISELLGVRFVQHSAFCWEKIQVKETR